MEIKLEIKVCLNCVNMIGSKFCIRKVNENVEKIFMLRNGL